MNIAFFEIKDWEKDILKAALPGHELSFHAEALTKETAEKARGAQAVSVFIYSTVDKEVLDLLPEAKLVATRSTGYDHINLDECKARNIAVANVPHYGENTVAEHTFALILSLSRNVHKSYLRSISNNYSIEGLKGFDLKGKTLGVVGAGRIGLHVIRIARAFGMKVLAFDAKKDDFWAEVLGFEYATLDELLSNSDIISLHVPAIPQTHHLINKESVRRIKKGALLINTARGSVADTQAIIEALDEGILRGVGLDVLEGEYLIKEEEALLKDEGNPEKLQELARNLILLKKDNVVFTPHIAFYSQEALERILHTTGRNIGYFAEGKSHNRVA